MSEPVRIGDTTLYCGDVLAVLATLPDESVHCVVTSPPYWGLRDYGTGTWEGGSAECDHKHFLGGHGEASKVQVNSQGTQEYQYKDVCGKCGARRTDQQIGLESSPEEYVARMVAVFREVRRVLRKDGTCWCNLGDSYATQPASNGVSFRRDRNGGNPVHPVPTGMKPKDLVGIPWMLAFALRADGWYLRSDIIWAKPNPMPESVTDRPTKAHEYLFLLSKSAHYFYDAEAIREPHDPASIARAMNPKNGSQGEGKRVDGYEAAFSDYHLNPAGRNRRTVWTIATEAFPGSHFATFPRKLVRPCILAGCPEHACPKCGAPWEKEVEHEIIGVKRNENGRYANADGKDGTNSYLSRTSVHGTKVTRTLGEHPTCACGLPAIGGTVLDPFGGSGTTAEVALEYGRRAILIELKPEYVELQKRRLAPVAGRPLLNFAEDA